MDVLAIDFGTSSTVGVLSIPGRGTQVVEIDGSVTMSSAIYADKDGTIFVGRDAERRARLDPSRFEANPKRRIDEGVLRLGELTIPIADAFAAVLRRVGEEAELLLSRQPGQVRISHPAGWGPQRKQILSDAALKAGFGSTILIPEPVAAAAHYASMNHGHARPSGPIAVYDLGAGTFDCAVVGVSDQGFAVLAEDGLSDLGSLDIDQALLVHIGREVSHSDPAQWQRVLRPQSVGERRTRRSLLQDVRDAKESLSRHQQTEIPMPEPFGDVRVTRMELEALVRPSFLRSAELLATTIRRAGLTPAHLGGIYLVGGPSRMPLLASLLANQLRVAPTTQDQPETAVAFGLHHVPAGGDDTQLTVPAFAPVTPPVQPPPPAQATQPLKRPQPPRWSPVTPQQPPPAQPGRNWQRPTMYGVIALAVASVIATLLMLTGGDSEPVAAGNTGAAAPPKPVDCGQPGQKDEQGFTDCLRRLAAVVPAKADCHDAPNAASSMGASSAVTCVFKSDEASNAINYYQGTSMNGLEDDVRRQMTKGDVAEGTWAVDGLRGRYVAGAGKRSGIVLFGTDDAPISAMLVSTRRDGTPRTTAEMVEFFTAQLKP